MNKRRKIILASLLISIAFCMLISVSYAYYLVGTSKTQNITASVDIPTCVGVSMTGGSLSLSGDQSAPVSDAKALGSTKYRYEFTVTNDCSATSNVKVALAPTVNSTMPIEVVKYALVEKDATMPTAGDYLFDANLIELDEKVIKEIKVQTSMDINYGYEMLSLTLAANESKTYYLYVWIDEYEGDTKNNTTMNKTFESYLVVSGWEPYGTLIEKTAFAVYSADDTSLTFYKNYDAVTNGSEYNGKTATAVYTGFETANYYSYSQVPWYSYRESITNVLVQDAITPSSLAYWFYNFKNATSFDLAKLNTSSITSMSNTFYYAGYNATTWDIGDLSNWDTSSVTDMSAMFSNAGYKATTWDIGDLSGWDVSKVTKFSGVNSNGGFTQNTNGMFASAGYKSTTWSIGDLSNWDTSSVTNMGNLFYNAGYSSTIWDIGDLSSWNTTSVTNMVGMFQSAGYKATTWNIGDLSRWDTSSVTSMSSMFASAGYKATTWSIGDLSNWDTSSVTNMYNMFYYAGYGLDDFDISYVANWDTSSVTNMSYMFSYAGYNATTWDIGDLSGWDTSSVTNMSSMFQYVPATSFDLRGWDVTNVTITSSMFNGCTAVTEAYARSQADADKLNASSNKPTTWSFTSVAPEITLTIDNQASDIVTINIPDRIEANYTKFTLVPIAENTLVTSFDMNGTTVSGNYFMSPSESGQTITISNVVTVVSTVIESEHNPYPNSMNTTTDGIQGKVYGEASFEGATSLTVILEYQTESTSFDWIYLYDSSGNIINNKKYGGSTLTTETITVSGSYVKIVFRTDSSGNNYYGFKATIYPN